MTLGFFVVMEVFLDNTSISKMFEMKEAMPSEAAR